MTSMEFKGHFTVNKNAEKILQVLRTPENLASCIYGLEHLEMNGDDFACKIRFDLTEAGVSYMNTISGKLKGKVIYQNDSIKIEGDGRSAGSKMSFGLLLTVKASGTVSEMEWEGTFDFGLIAKVIGESKVKTIAQKNIEKTIELVVKKLEN